MKLLNSQNSFNLPQYYLATKSIQAFHVFLLQIGTCMKTWVWIQAEVGKGLRLKIHCPHIISFGLWTCLNHKTNNGLQPARTTHSLLQPIWRDTCMCCGVLSSVSSVTFHVLYFQNYLRFCQAHEFITMSQTDKLWLLKFVCTMYSARRCGGTH